MFFQLRATEIDMEKHNTHTHRHKHAHTHDTHSHPLHQLIYSPDWCSCQHRAGQRGSLELRTVSLMEASIPSLMQASIPCTWSIYTPFPWMSAWSWSGTGAAMLNRFPCRMLVLQMLAYTTTSALSIATLSFHLFEK